MLPLLPAIAADETEPGEARRRTSAKADADSTLDMRGRRPRLSPTLPPREFIKLTAHLLLLAAAMLRTLSHASKRLVRQASSHRPRRVGADLVVNADGTHVRQLTTGPSSNYSPSWQPV